MKTFYPFILLATTMSMVTVQANVISLLNMTKDLGETIIDKTDLESFVPGLSDFFIATMKFVTRLIQCDEKTEFTCPDDNFCYPIQERCDGIGHCDDDSDEENCEEFRLEHPCLPNRFSCNNSKCIPSTWVCDDMDDCGDDSDEIDC